MESRRRRSTRCGSSHSSAPTASMAEERRVTGERLAGSRSRMQQPPREVSVRAPIRGSSIALAALLLLGPVIAGAQPRGAGRDFRFGPPTATLTLHGGLAMPTAGSDLWSQ